MLGQAAARLGVSRDELEVMIAAGNIEALPTGFTRTIPIREIERLAKRGPTSSQSGSSARTPAG